MRIKLFLSLLLAGTLVSAAQHQGYKDGIEYYKAGQYDNAKTILDRTLNDGATDKSLANYYLGQIALAKGQKAEAKQYFDKGIALNAENPYNYVGLGALELINNQAAAAEENFKTAQKLSKKNSEVSVEIARSYYKADPVKYAKEMDKAMLTARKASKSQEPAIYVLEGDMLSDQQNYGEAAGRYENAITFDPNNPEGYVKYANAYFYVNKDFAIKKLEEYLASHPQSAMVQRELAEKYFQADRWRAASELYGKYIQNPNSFPEDKSRYAVLLYWGERYPEALATSREILAENPTNFQTQRVLFLTENAMGDYENAVRDAEKFFKANPNGNFNVNDYTTYAAALSGLGQDSLAILQYEAAAIKFPENGDLLKDLSSIYNKNKQYAKGADAYAAYLNMQTEPTPDDLYGMATRYLQAAGSATEPEQQKELAEKGKKYINQLIEDPSIKPIPQFYQRLAFLNIAGNDKKPNEEAVVALDKMLELLDADPANLDPNNENNQLQLYKNAYAFEQAYYSAIKNEEKRLEFVEKYNAIQKILNPTAE